MTPEQMAKLTPVQRESIARADAKIAVGEELYRLRNRLFFFVGQLPTEELRQLVGLVNTLSASQLRQVAAFAETLAEWDSGG